MKKVNKSSGGDKKPRTRTSGPGKKRRESESGNRASFGEKKSYGDKPKRSFSTNRDEKPKRSYGSDRSDSKPSFRSREQSSEDRPKRNYGGERSDSKPSYRSREQSSEDRPKRNYGGERSDSKPSFRSREQSSEDRPRRNYGGERSDSKSSFRSREQSSEDRPRRNYGGDRSDSKPSYRSREQSSEDRPRRNYGGDRSDSKPSFRSSEQSSDDRPKRNYSKDVENPKAWDESTSFKKHRYKQDDKPGSRYASKPKKQSSGSLNGEIRLNKYLSNAGIASRREADKLIEVGTVTVNGKIITELGYKVMPGDVVTYSGERISLEKKVYILLNKPKDYITTADDPQERRTVLDLIAGACPERVYPVGRLDRNTTGVLLLTNDGEITKKLTHPRFGIPKVYQVELDKAVSRDHLHELFEGFELEDGFVKVDNASYVEGGTKKEVGVEIHSGRNRIVRRMFEHLGYEVIKLDRVSFAGMTKKNLARGRWRFLTETEVSYLKMIS